MIWDAKDEVRILVIVSLGVGTMEHFYEAFVNRLADMTVAMWDISST